VYVQARHADARRQKCPAACACEDAQCEKIPGLRHNVARALPQIGQLTITDILLSSLSGGKVQGLAAHNDFALLLPTN